MKRILLTLALSWPIAALHAQSIDFGKIGSGEQAFKQYWQLSDEEAKRYNNYMAVAGKYRHQHLDPLTVLSIIADSPEDKQYYAQKAALHEHKTAMREIESAWLISTAMEGKLATEMQQFTDALNGIDTVNYQPRAAAHKPEWQAGDKYVLLLDERCLTIECIKQHSKSAQAAAAVDKVAVIKGKTPLSAEAQQALQALGLKIQRFDPIEHRTLGEAALNRALHLRANRVIDQL